MVNTNIPMSVQPLDTATPIVQANNQQLTNAMGAEQILKAHYENMDARERSRLTSTVAGAVQLKSYLDNEDLDGAHDFLMKRKTALHNRMASGENVDTQETDAALEMLRGGKIDELKNGIQGLMAAGQVYGILSNKDMPSNVQEWMYYNSLTPQDQQNYLTMKRSNQTLNLGGTQMVVGPTGTPVSQYPVTLRPEDEPINAEAKAQATAEGTGAGERNVAMDKKEFDAVANRNYINKALTLLPKSTNGGIATVGKKVSGAVGESTEATRADRQLSILSAKLVGTVPRFEGPQGVLDVQLYQEAAGDLANTKLPRGDRQAAAQLMLDLLDEYGATGMGGGAVVRMLDPSTGDVYDVPESDAAAAEADGLVRQ